MKTLFLILLLIVIGVLGFIRLAPTNVDKWHIDPVSAIDPGEAGALLVPGDVTSPLPPEQLLARFDAIVLDQPRSTTLAGSVDDLHISYVVRSKWFGFPDYVTVRALPTATGSTLAVLSRLRFGFSDAGVNRARLDGWLRALDALDQ